MCWKRLFSVRVIAEADDFVYTRENSVDGNNFVDKGSLMTISVEEIEKLQMSNNLELKLIRIS